ncbi:MAG: ADP-glyceromanno-heptose 6-epimerase [Rhodospirillaceae bacterium]|nr:ADP-glyceromanno-heptose 6-epimerase [Rhodospirillaceae bacterium]|tara:strand:- start:8265 stop:9248 length:984 start_codon:yes stop_codon:yes gene_type:complete
MIIVTGAAGFIGSNLVKGLNRLGYTDILAVDDLTDGHKFLNLADTNIADYWDKDLLLKRLKDGLGFVPHCVFHQGACSVTTEWNGRYMMENNYHYSKELLHYCHDENVSFIYASSAAVYGNNSVFEENSNSEYPINIYGYSKLLFDNYVRRNFLQKSSVAETSCQIVGLRYFNVYGPGEAHKAKMASVAFHLNQQVQVEGEARLFEGNDGLKDGEQRRDFVHIDDVISVNLWMFENPEVFGIFNVGTGKASSFNEVADSIIDWHGKGVKCYIPFPENLVNSYQSYTQAEIEKLRSVGYKSSFLDVKLGIKKYLDVLNNDIDRRTQKK